RIALVPFSFICPLEGDGALRIDLQYGEPLFVTFFLGKFLHHYLQVRHSCLQRAVCEPIRRLGWRPGGVGRVPRPCAALPKAAVKLILVVLVSSVYRDGFSEMGQTNCPARVAHWPSRSSWPLAETSLIARTSPTEFNRDWQAHSSLCEPQ